METLLNLVWALIAVAAFFFWRAQRRSGGASRFTDRTQAVALVCVLVLLFFPISLTDDLHPEIFLAADSVSPRRHLSAIPAIKSHDVSSRVRGVVLFFALIPARIASLRFVSVGPVDAEALRAQRWLIRSAATRSPPFLPA